MNSVPNRAMRAALLLSALLLGVEAHAQAPADDAALASRGEYLARAADCMPCHTGDKSKPYAGGLPIHTPFGTIFSVNITSDPETGIGRYTYGDFKNAVHDGIRADGAYRKIEEWRAGYFPRERVKKGLHSGVAEAVDDQFKQHRTKSRQSDQ